MNPWWTFGRSPICSLFARLGEVHLDAGAAVMVCNYAPTPKQGTTHPDVRNTTDPRPADPIAPVSLRTRDRYLVRRNVGSLETCTPTASRGREAPARACGGRRNHRGTLPGAALLLRSAPVARERHVGLPPCRNRLRGKLTCTAVASGAASCRLPGSGSGSRADP